MTACHWQLYITMFALGREHKSLPLSFEVKCWVVSISNLHVCSSGGHCPSENGVARGQATGGGRSERSWSFTLFKVSAVGVSAFSEEWSPVISGGDSIEIANFEVLKNRGFQMYLCSSGWNRNRWLVGCLQKEKKEMFAGNKGLIENRKNNFLSRF